MNPELEFLCKVVRNAVILAGMYFVSVWATTQQLDFLMHIKPILIFLLTYTGTELVKRYKIDSEVTKKKITTLIF